MKSRIGRNAFWNVAGVVLPSLAGLLAMPMLLRGLGVERLGVFTLALGLIGFSGVFDLGLGRALTQLIASEGGRGTTECQLSALVRRALWALLGLGTFWGILVWLAAPLVVGRFFASGSAILQEAVSGIRWIATSLPFALISTGLVGCLEGRQRFALVNAIRMPLGVASFLVPAVTALLSSDLGSVVASLAMVRIAATVVWLYAGRSSYTPRNVEDGASVSADRLMRFGAWLTVSNIAGPLMVYADRFYLASILPAGVVAFYTVPLDAASRLGALPMSAVNAAFPALSSSHSDTEHGAAIIRGAEALILSLWLPPLMIGTLLAKELLMLWLGASFAASAVPIVKWLLIGVFLNGFALLPYALIQAGGRADITAKLHLFELPIYALIVVVLVAKFGILGAAIAWTARIALDAALLVVMAANVAPQYVQVLRAMAAAALIGSVFLLTGAMIEMAGLRWAFVMLAAFAFARALLKVKDQVFVQRDEVDGTG